MTEHSSPPAFWYAAGESSEASSGINWQTIIFIAGMMIMVEGMAKVGFFRWLCMRNRKDGKISGYSDLYDVYATVLSYWLCSSTVLPLSCFWQQLRSNCPQLLEFDPVPMILIGNLLCRISEDRQRCAEIRQTLLLVHPWDITFHRLYYQYRSDGSRIPGICRYLFLLCILEKNWRRTGQIKKIMLPVSRSEGSNHQTNVDLSQAL